MFDIGFWELVLISVLGLLVLGPERLPGAIRSVLSVVRSVKQAVSSVSTELKQELELDELHQNLKQAEQNGLESLNGDLQASVETLKARAESVSRPYQKKTVGSPQPAEAANQAVPSDSDISQEDNK
ncbi:MULTISPECIES: Sec-independent protein translocase protein TatB [unclassified Agarivorans]|uniref:Sec-independent protein translocase protein TatB n=1 Tax=unclassified Agarivorans TaxID=2636026 RepID=UPI003D7CE61C